MKRRRRFLSKIKNLQTTLAAWAMEILSSSLSHVPEPFRHWLIRAVGALYGVVAVRQKAALTHNLKTLLQIDQQNLSQITREIFKSFSMTLYDFFVPNGIRVDVPDREKLEALRLRCGGFLVLTFHMGNWELGARSMRDWGWPVTAVFQPYTNKKFKEMIEKRRAAGVHFIPVGKNAAAGVRQALKRGDVVAMLGDHPFGEVGTAVNLLGHRVIWPKGPVVLAVKENAPIVVAVVLRTGPRHYRAIVADPLFPKGKDRVAVESLVQEVADKFGTLLKQHPTQWYRFRPLQFVE